MSENLFPAGTFAPDPRPAPVPRMLAAQYALDLKLLLRNGEQLLLTMFIPITLLVGMILLPLGDFGPDRAARRHRPHRLNGADRLNRADRRQGAHRPEGAARTQLCPRSALLVHPFEPRGVVRGADHRAHRLPRPGDAAARAHGRRERRHGRLRHPPAVAAPHPRRADLLRRALHARRHRP